MVDEQTMWSQTLLEDFISGMKKKPSDEWIKEKVRELNERGMSVDYLSKVLSKDLSEVAGQRLLNVMGGKTSSGSKKKKGLLDRFFS